MFCKSGEFLLAKNRLGITEHIGTWEPIEQGVDIVNDISVEFSLEVLQFIHFIGEFADD